MIPAIDPVLRQRLIDYARLRGLKLQTYLGGGIQGVVFSTDASTAIKAFKYEVHYRQEVEVYRRIKQAGISSICGFQVPTPIRRSDPLMVLEMGLVQPPFVLDFASAGLDGPLNEHSAEALQEWEESPTGNVRGAMGYCAQSHR